MLLAQVIETPDVDVEILLPMIFMGVGGLLILTMSSVKKDIPAWFITGWTVVASLAAIVASISLWSRYTEEGGTSTIADSVGFDGFSLFITVVIALSVIMSSLLAHTYLTREHLEGVELHVLLLLSGTGGIIMAFSNDLTCCTVSPWSTGQRALPTSSRFNGSCKNASCSMTGFSLAELR